jgi:hypothetical protein
MQDYHTTQIAEAVSRRTRLRNAYVRQVQIRERAIWWDVFISTRRRMGLGLSHAELGELAFDLRLFSLTAGTVADDMADQIEAIRLPTRREIEGAA